MKRLLTFAFIIIASTGMTNAQFVSVTYHNHSGYQENNYSQDIRELRNFEHQLDKFSYFLMIEDLRSAHLVKQIIIEDMDREIRQTRIAWRNLQRAVEGHNSGRGRARGHRQGNGNVYSKRNGSVQNGDLYYRSEILANRLAKQQILRDRFIDTPLYTRGRRAVFANRHRNLMYDFRDTMRKDIDVDWNRDQLHERGRNRDRRG